MKKPTAHDRHEQALRALNHAIACMVAWPPSDERLGGAVYFTALALQRLAQADPEGKAAAWAEKYLAEAQRSKSGVIDLSRIPRDHAPRISVKDTRIIGCTCGWRVPRGSADADTALVEHVALAKVIP